MEKQIHWTKQVGLLHPETRGTLLEPLLEPWLSPEVGVGY